MSRRIREIAGKGKMRVVGLMSGTSADGVDAAVVEIDRGKVRLLAFEMFSYPAALRRRILGLCRPDWMIYAITISSWAKSLPMRLLNFVPRAA